MLMDADSKTEFDGTPRRVDPWSGLPSVMSKSAYGDYRRQRFGRGSAPMVTKWIAGGKITPPALTDDGKIARDLADRQLAERLDPARSNAADLLGEGDPADDLPDDFDELDDPPADQPSAAAPDPAAVATAASYNEERVAHMRAQRRLKEMEIAEREGRLVDAAKVEAMQFDMARMVRDRLLGLASETAGALVGRDERDIAARLRDAISEKLASISDEIENAGGA